METPPEDDRAQAGRRAAMGRVLWWVLLALALSVTSFLTGFFGSFRFQ